ncbi:pseudouridine synthase [Aromatoleum sp.]|uniref:pseudouridine synthase n=1 Tax=Aromatoleum sp. TaxID=2307007 RepID=UPI002FCA9273
MKRSSSSGDAGKTDPEVDGAPPDSAAAGGQDAAAGGGRKTLGIKPTAADGDAAAKKPGLRTRFLPSAERRGKPPERNAGPKGRERDPRSGMKAAAADAARGPRREREGRDEAAARAGREDRPRREERPARQDHAAERSRPSGERGAPPDKRAVREERPLRDDRGSRENRASRDDRPARENPREGRPLREDRRLRESGPAREGRPSRGDRPGREDRPGRVPEAAGRGNPAVKRKTPADERPARARRPEGTAGAPDRHDAPRKHAPAAAPSEARAEGVRLSKVMADRGICSRREADEIIERGWVFVDGQRVSELGIRIDPNAEITLAAQAKRRQAEQVTILLHKPVGYVSGQPEPGFEPAVSLIGPDNQFDARDAQRFHVSHLKGLAPAGRLDIDSTGLLVLTQNGRIARQLIGEESKVEKEYLVRVEGELDAGGLALLNHGLELDGRKLRPAKVEWLNEDQLRFVLREGRKRQIRRMCELVGLKVVGLKRVRIGGVRLGDLPLGQWRFLREDESF